MSDVSEAQIAFGALSASLELPRGVALKNRLVKAAMSDSLGDGAGDATGGFKTRVEAADAVASGVVDVVGLARLMVLDPDLPTKWLRPEGGDPQFPTFTSPPPGGITAWYSMYLTALANNNEGAFDPPMETVIADYETRDDARIDPWRNRFSA